jgi:tRNA threonylcarbamoyladenosine biosynthesis protein TsaB
MCWKFRPSDLGRPWQANFCRVSAVVMLAIDTCFDACSVAVADLIIDGIMIRSAEREPMTRGHAEALPRMVERVLASWGKSGRDVSMIAVTHGPGTFAGTRIGVAFARGLGLARGVRVVGFSSLHALATPVATAFDRETRRTAIVIAAVDARRGELYVQTIGGDYDAITPPELLTAEMAIVRIPVGIAYVVGSGAATLVEAATRAGRHDIAMAAGADPVPDARAVAFLAGRLTAGAIGTAAPRPLYLRPPDTTAPVAASVP